MRNSRRGGAKKRSEAYIDCPTMELVQAIIAAGKSFTAVSFIEPYERSASSLALLSPEENGAGLPCAPSDL
jgi:hypothetical protein